MKNIIKKVTKIFITILTIQIIFSFSNTSKAENITWEDIIQKGNEFITDGQNTAEQGKISKTQENGDTVEIQIPTGEEVKPILDHIYNILFGLGFAVTVIIGGVLGINFMVESTEGRAKIKESLIPYIAGCIVIYGALGIWKLAVTIFSGI